MALDTLSQLERLGFPDLLLWLLTFAIVYGVLKQANIPKSEASRAIIAIVSGLFVLMAAPASLITIISKMSTNLILIILGLLTLIAFLEASGTKVSRGSVTHSGPGERKIYDRGKGQEPISVFKKHGLEIGIIVLILVGLVFVGSGGLSVLGIQNINLTEQSTLTIGILVLVILAAGFLYTEKGEKEEE